MGEVEMFMMSCVLMLCVPLAEADPLEVELGRALRPAFARLNAPGALVGVFRAGKPPLRFALGLADVEAKRAMTPDCHFRIASVSKVFVGTALLTLVDEGKLSADDTIAKYVPGIPNGDTVTIRHLATHRSGLFNHIESPTVKKAFAGDPSKIWKENELLEFAQKGKTYFEPGKSHHYSNTNTVLLAMVIEKVTGKPWRDEVTRRVLTPLKLKNTVIPTDNALPKPFAQGYALGGDETPFFVRGKKQHRVTLTSPSWWGPSGNIISTLDDLGAAMKPLGTGSLLKDKGRKELHTWTRADQPGFEYGFHLERVKGRLGHDGDVPGYQTFAYYWPEQDVTVVACVNLYGWSVRGMPANTLGEAVFKVLATHGKATKP
jgi:D-alanyl-D-alanine carboxypeptidase